jgi:hypothetical protein
MYVTRLSCYIWLSVLSAVSHNRGSSWNVLPVDTGAVLYLFVRFEVMTADAMATAPLGCDAM